MMQHTKKSPPPKIIATTERLLAEAYGGPIHLDTGVDLGGSDRSNVYRFHILDGPDTVPASVVVKHANIPPGSIPDANSMNVGMLFNDWAAVQFLSQHLPDATLAPRFYMGDRENALFIMEDLGQGERLDHLLLGHDATAAEAALIDYATIHGRLHALTSGRQADYHQLREYLGPGSFFYNYAETSEVFRAVSASLGIALTPGIEAELASISAMLEHPGPFQAFIQADACPDNIIRVGESWRLLDFEGAGFTHALLEGVYSLVPFPTCWCVYRLPEKIVRRMETAYRPELIRGCSIAADDTQFYQAVAAASVFWVFNIPTFVPLAHVLERDLTLISLSDRQRYLLVFDNLARILENTGSLPIISIAIRAMADKLHQLWPELHNIPYYPAFQ